MIIYGGWSWLDARCPSKLLCHSPLQLTVERKCNEMLMGWNKDSKRSLTSYHHKENRFDPGKSVYFITYEIRVKWKIKSWSWNTFPWPLLSLPPPLQWRMMGSGGHFLTSCLSLLPPQGHETPDILPLLQHRRQSSTNFSNILLMQCTSQTGPVWIPFKGCNPSGKTAPVCVSWRVTSHASKPALMSASFSISLGPARSRQQCRFPISHSLLWAPG